MSNLSLIAIEFFNKIFHLFFFYSATLVFVKYLEDTLHEEWLQHNFIQFNQKQNRASVVISPSWWMLPVDMVFVLIA